jgi:DNA polymerase-3 subunit gamma/tau
MSYIALARKWRPRTFLELVGQEHINKAIINSLNQQRLHHAYLFSGTRGIGKTSIARLFAKALNCEIGITATPCLQCETCLAIEQGRFIDLLEIDGASKTRVEDTREILENVQYSPTNGRFKIYLIDEVHMLSQHSFNALLKTLEEPPGHVKFLLATTEPQKLPVTVLSRCLQFNLKPLQEEVILQHLQHILDTENLTYESRALELLCKAAKGSMRDALTLLDQAIALGDLLTESVHKILGYTQHDYAFQLLHALALFDVQNLIMISREIAKEGGSFRYVLEEMLSYLHQILLCHKLPGNSPFIAPKQELIALSKSFSSEDAQLFYQIALRGLEEIELAPTLGIGFEITLLRMHTFRPAVEISPPPLAHETTKAEEFPVVNQSKPTLSLLYREAAVADEAPTSPTIPTSAIEPIISADWKGILHALRLSGLALNAAENTQFIGKDGRIIILQIDSGHQSLFTASVKGRIEQALSQYYREEIQIKLKNSESVCSTPALERKIAQDKKLNEAETTLNSDEFLQQLQQEFSAEIIKNSIILSKGDL